MFMCVCVRARTCVCVYVFHIMLIHLAKAMNSIIQLPQGMGKGTLSDSTLERQPAKEKENVIQTS